MCGISCGVSNGPVYCQVGDDHHSPVEPSSGNPQGWKARMLTMAVDRPIIIGCWLYMVRPPILSLGCMVMLFLYRTLAGLLFISWLVVPLLYPMNPGQIVGYVSVHVYKL